MATTDTRASRSGVHRRRAGISALQKRLLFLCFNVIAIDGFDTAIIGYIAPAMRAEWGLAVMQLGPLFAAGLFGLMPVARCGVGSNAAESALPPTWPPEMQAPREDRERHQPEGMGRQAGCRRRP